MCWYTPILTNIAIKQEYCHFDIKVVSQECCTSRQEVTNNQTRNYFYLTFLSTLASFIDVTMPSSMQSILNRVFILNIKQSRAYLKVKESIYKVRDTIPSK